MIVENRGQQQSIRYVIDTDRCCGCKKCIRRCMENVWQWDEEKKYCVLKNGIELSKFKFQSEIREKIRKSLGVENNFVIGHAGRFSTQKNHTFLWPDQQLMPVVFHR